MRTILLMFVCVALQSRIWADEQVAPANVRQAVHEYLSRIEEIDRAAAAAKSQAKSRLEQALQGQITAPSGTRYRGMLGSYFNQDGRIPFILLSVPDGENVFGEYARSVFNGKYDFSKPLYCFRARGHVVVPHDGTYYLEVGRGYGDFKLNGLGYILNDPAPRNRYSAKVELKKGEYEVELSTNNNGGQLPESSIRIVDLQREKELPLFIYESELKTFESELGLGVELIETSKWQRERNRLE